MLTTYHLNNPGGGGCEGGFAALTPPIFPYLLRRSLQLLLYTILYQNTQWRANRTFVLFRKDRKCEAFDLIGSVCVTRCYAARAAGSVSG